MIPFGFAGWPGAPLETGLGGSQARRKGGQLGHLGIQVSGKGGYSEVREVTGSRRIQAASLENVVDSCARREARPAGFPGYSCCKHSRGHPRGGHAAHPCSPPTLSSDSHVQAAPGLSLLKPERQ